MPPPLILTEGAPPQRFELSPAEFEALGQLAIADVTLTRQSGVYEVAAGRKIGAVSIGDRQVVVRPKIVDLNRLVFLLGFSVNRDIWRDDVVRLTEADDLLPALAEAFSRLASGATEQGLIQGYRTVQESLPVLRGRLLVGEQMTRRFGLPVPVAVEYDDYTVDVTENRLLLAATQRLLKVPGLSRLARQHLQRLRVTMADVGSLTRGQPLPHWQPSRLNRRYHDALRLAEVVLAAQSFEHRVGDLAVTGFMFDMWRIFEDFVCSALGEALDRRKGRSVAQWRTFLDIADEVRMKPDLVWMDEGRDVRAVIDAKYKAERPEGFPDADIYQVLAYCTALGLSDGHLVYAQGNEVGRVNTVRRVGIALHCHTVDLAQSPADLLAQIETIANKVATSSTHPPR